MDEESAIPIVPCVFTAVIIIVIRIFNNRSSNPKLKSNIPWAPGAVPILGHALKYRDDPVQFLLNATEKVGDIFQINLAGKRMIVACGPSVQRAIANAPESVMSARRAVAEMGFGEMLGPLNVYQGTDLHKGIIKGLWHSGELEVVAGCIKSVRNALQVETSTLQNDTVEFMSFIRRARLRSVVEYFIGPFFLDNWEFNFIEEYMTFQDTLEDVTAKSAVMPRSLALPLLLWPFRRRRLELQRIILNRLKNTLPSIQKQKEGLGFWLAAVQGNFAVDEISQFIIGLLFAAHKNPAIGTAQSYLMLHQGATAEQKRECIKESTVLLSNTASRNIDASCPSIHRLCFETLRLTAHSLGGIRIAAEDFSITDGLTIPKGSTVALAHITSSLNADIWEDPGNLDLDAASKSRSGDRYRNEYNFTVFSHGIHKCPGQRNALTVMECTVAILLAEYEIDLPEVIPPLCFERATLAQRSGPVHVVISRKNVHD